MNNTLLKRYIKEILSEMQDYRVPTQLISPNTGEKVKPEENEEEDMEKEIDEMSMAGGGIAGFTAPLGMSGDDLRKPGKKKKSGWK